MHEKLYNLERASINRVQFSNLIEICDDLFPGYQFLDTQSDNQMHIVFMLDGSKNGQAISWFELCIIDIPIRLSKRINKPCELIIETWIYSQNEHLIDYLYQLYKKHT